MKPVILDCTIRDGGHLNDWAFDPAVVRATYVAARRARVDYFEVGYRYPETRAGLGAFAHCQDALLDEVLPPGDGPTITVMIDAGKCDASAFVDVSSGATRVRAVRVAAYPYELERAFGLIDELLAKGYEVFLNLMAASELTEAEFSLLAAFPSKGRVSALCFADSFGSFLPDQVRDMASKLAPLGFPRLGFHPHNNLQLAFANTLCAIEAGVEVVDASVFGMGRGAGNLPIELLVGHLETRGHRTLNVAPYLHVIERHFGRLSAETPWGYSPGGLMSGLTNLHPYYINALTQSGLYTTDEMWNALGLIKARCPISYSAQSLKQVMEERLYVPLTEARAEAICAELSSQIHVAPDAGAEPTGQFSLAQRHPGRHFLVIGTGPSVVRHLDAIRRYVERWNCVTIGVNNLAGVFEPDYHVFVSRRRFERYIGGVAPRSTLLLPSHFGRAYVDSHTDQPVVYFDCHAPASRTEPPLAGQTQQCLALNVGISGILAAFQMGAAEIGVVGMDGYLDSDERHMRHFHDEEERVESTEFATMRYELMAAELDRVDAFLEAQGVPFSILTPTSHRRFYRSDTSFGEEAEPLPTGGH